jgi:hypothetical protein
MNTAAIDLYQRMGFEMATSRRPLRSDPTYTLALMAARSAEIAAFLPGSKE